MTTNFKVGDKVRYIDEVYAQYDEKLQTGEVVEVVEVIGYTSIRVTDNPHYWYFRRFELVERPETPQELADEYRANLKTCKELAEKRCKLAQKLKELGYVWKMCNEGGIKFRKEVVI